MNLLAAFRFVILVIYILLFGYLFPKSGTTYDLFKLRLNLYPYWTKFSSVFLIITSIILVIITHEYFEEWKSFLLTILNLSLFMLVFSKEKYEDEFSEQMRFKSFTYAFITFLVFAGIYGAISIGRPNSVFFLNYVYIQAMTGLFLLVSLTYFYYTKYKFIKENK